MEKNMLVDIFDMNLKFKIWFEKDTKNGNQSLIGEKKIELLKLIQETGSIKAAAETIDLDFKLAWEMINSINERFDPHHVVVSTRGGGGGTHLTSLGIEILQKYSAINDILKKIIPRLGDALEGTISKIEKDDTNNDVKLQIELKHKKYSEFIETKKNVFIIPIE